jgi:hypothetical protein
VPWLGRLQPATRFYSGELLPIDVKGGARDGDAITRAVVLPQTLLICGP